MRNKIFIAVKCHAVNLVSCHPEVTQHCESPAHGHASTGSRSPHLPHWRLLLDLIRPLTRASSWRISSAMHSAISYGARPGRRAAHDQGAGRRSYAPASPAPAHPTPVQLPVIEAQIQEGEKFTMERRVSSLLKIRIQNTAHTDFFSDNSRGVMI